MTSEDLEAAKAVTVRATQDKTNLWMKSMGFMFPGQTRTGLMEKLAEFRKTSAPKPASRDWARIMKSRIADGIRYPIVCEALCTDALRIPSRGDEE